MSTRPELAAPPGFRTLNRTEETPQEEVDEALSSPESSQEDASSPGPRTSTSGDRPTSPPSSTAASTEVADALGGLVAGAARLASMLANRAVKAKRHVETELWLMSEQEAFAIGTPLGRIAARRTPSELSEGDGPDLLEAGGALLGYAAHNAAGMTAADMERHASGQVVEARATEVRHPEPPPPAREAPPAPAEEPRAVRLEGVVPPAGAPGVPINL